MRRRIDCRRWQVVSGPEKRAPAIRWRRERGPSDVATKQQAKRHQSSGKGGKAQVSRATHQERVPAGGRHLGSMKPCTFHEGYGGGDLGSNPYVLGTKVPESGEGRATGVSVTRLCLASEEDDNAFERSKEGPSWRAAGVNRQLPEKASRATLGHRSGITEHGCSFFACGWQSSAGFSLALTWRGVERHLSGAHA
jgi:hypothetical protein